MKKKRVLILGGGFGGIYAALEFEKRQDPDFEVTLISQDNFFLFTSMLHEVAASDLDLTHIVNPIRSREGKVLAHNIVANSRGKDLIPFRFNTLGLLASIGRRTGVARILGLNFSGFVAWWLWRTIYLLKLPRVEKKVRVALDWTLDVFFTKDFVQYLHQRSTPFVNTPITSSDIGPKNTDTERLSMVH